MRLVGLFILFFCLVSGAAAQVETPVRLKGPKNMENPVRSRVGPLTANDTLWRIAEEVRPHPGLNMYQVMYAIFMKNPDAFLDDNFNHLNHGSFLSIPTIDEILAVDAAQAQRKSEEDDRIWAQRVRAAAAVKVQEGLVTARQQDVDKARDEIKTELSRVEELQKQQLVELQKKLAESNATVETVLTDNTALKEKLDTLTEQLLKVQSQVDKDSEIQKQLEMLVQQQTEMLEQQRAQIAREQEGFNFARWWQKVSDSGLSWVLIGTLPVLVILTLVLGWLKRRTRHTEDVVTAATAAPQQDPHYKSPLPPLDDSLDFDESSLMTLDESLLGNSAKSGVRLDDDPLDLSDDLLGSAKGSSFNDVLLDDDELLDTKDLLSSSNLDDELLDDLLDEATPEAPGGRADFDPDNILSGTDLSSLLEDDSLDESADDIFAQAVAEQLATEEKQKAAQSTEEPPADDELIEEIELDDLEPEEVRSPPLQPDEVEEVDFDSLLEELQAEPPLVIDEVGPELVLAEELELAAGSETDELLSESTQFDSTELDEFAESLVDEELTADWPEEAQIDDEAVSPEPSDTEFLTEQMDAAEAGSSVSEAALQNESDYDTDISAPTDLQSAQEPATEVASENAPDAIGADLENSGSGSLKFDEDDYPLTPDDVALLLNDEERSSTEMPAQFHADHQELTDQVDGSDELLNDTVLADDLLSEDESQSWQELSESLSDEVAVAPMPDLDGSEDATVSRVSEAALSVEKPSQVLEQYPELELGDDFVEEQDEELQTESDFLPGAELDPVSESDEVTDAESEPELPVAPQNELDELENLDFDQLLADVSQPDPQLDEPQDEDTAAAVLAELELDTAAEAGSLSGDLVDVDQSLLELDSLLQESDDTEDVTEGAPASLSVDVGLEDYKEFIAGQQESEVDPMEQIYGADLDLIRAYLEIGEQEGAEQLIDRLLAADELPEGVRAEVVKLQQQLES
ncbi:FimV/HubP family polar landmark protein [Rheinheimera sp.]|uniref:FimV/HubP family polar landmark protein n=1 Tax=Rheinheimera sp. TaxID=1869214 RepID=UPI00307D9CCD